MNDWLSIPEADWLAHGNTYLAKRHGTTPEAVRQARLRLNMPASPEHRGGDRKTHSRYPATPTTFVIHCTHGQKTAWITAARQLEKKPEQWAAQILDNAKH